MFKELVSAPVYPITNKYIERLHRPTGEPDLSLTMLGIACLKDKVPDYDGIQGCHKTGYTRRDIRNDFVENYINSDAKVQFCYYVYTNDKEQEDPNEDIIIQHGFVHKEAVEMIAAQKIPNEKIEVLYNPNRNQALIITSYRGYELYHLILSFLPLYYPNIYTKPISKDDPEVKVLASLSKMFSTLFKKEISEIVGKYKNEFVYAQISGLIKDLRMKEISEAESEYENLWGELERIKRLYQTRMNDVRNARIKLEGVKAVGANNEQEEEIANYLVSNNEIRNITVQDSVINFTVATTLKQFSTDSWQIFSQNGGIYDGPYTDHQSGREVGWNPVGLFATKENRKLLFDNIFSEDPKFEVKLAGNYSIDFRNNYFRTRRDYNYVENDPIFTDYLPNPHLMIFACLGQYEPKVVDRLMDGDIVTAMELAVYSAGSVDLDETMQTFRPFLGMIMHSDKKILRRFDGVDMTPAEALVWLVDNKENKE